MRMSDWSSDVCSSYLEYLRKGSQVYVEGEIRYDKYTGQDGVEKYFTEIVANEMQMLGGRGEGGGGGGGGGGGSERTSRPRQDSAPQRQAQSPQRQSRSEEHTSELQSLMRISYAVFCLKKKNK